MIHVDVRRRGLAPVSTGASSEEGAASTKEVPVGEGSGEVRLGRRAVNKFNGYRLGRFASRRETRTVPGWSSWHSWVSSCTLRGGLGEACIRGIENVLVSRRTESGEDFAADGPGAIERGVLTPTVDTERRRGIAASHDRLLKALFRTALVSTSVGGVVMERSADWGGLCLFCAQRSRVTKTPALSALRGFGGRVGGGDRAGAREM